MNIAKWVGICLAFIAVYSLLFFGDTTSHYGYHLLLKNLWWASLALVIDRLFVSTYGVFKLVSFAIWLSLIPNSFYLMTDLAHPIIKIGFSWEVWKDVFSLDFSEALKTSRINLLRFSLFGLSGWCLGMGSTLEILKDKFFRNHFKLYLYLFSFLISVGIMLGRKYRLYSYDIILEFPEVINSLESILQSKMQISVIFLTMIAIAFTISIALSNSEN